MMRSNRIYMMVCSSLQKKPPNVVIFSSCRVPG